jgi:hypothetical protein
MVVEMKLLERRLTLYEEKYGVLSEDFYAALMSGKLARYDGFDETRADFSRWKGIYETWRRRKAAYDQQVKTKGVDDFPHPDDPSLASTFPHHKHQPPDIRHHRVPAPELSFSTPNLPFLLRTLAELAAGS